MIVMDIDEEELNSLSASYSFSLGPLSCSDKAESNNSGLQRTADQALEKELIPHEHQHQPVKEEVMEEQDNFKTTHDIFVIDVDEEEFKSLVANVSSGEDLSSQEGENKGSDQTKAHPILEKELSFGLHDHQHQLSTEETAEKQGNFNRIRDVTVADIIAKDSTASPASSISSVEPISSCSEVKGNASGIQTTAGHALEKRRPLGPHEHQFSREQEVMEQLDNLSGLVDMFISAILKEQLNSLSVNYTSSIEPVSCYSEDLPQSQVSSDTFQGIPGKEENRETDTFFSEILEQVMYRSSVPCSSVERLSYSSEVTDEVLELRTTEDQVPLELQCQPSGELRVASLPFSFSDLPSNLVYSDRMLHERIRADDPNQLHEDIQSYMSSLDETNLPQAEVSDVKQIVQSCILDQPTGTSAVRESLVIVTDKMKTLPPSVPSLSCEGTTPTTEENHSFPQPQGKFWDYRFHFITKLRIKTKHFKNRIESQESQIQSSDNFEVLLIPSEVKGKTLPPSVPSLLGEEALPGTESDHSLPEPQGRYKWRVNKFHLVPKFRTKTQHHKHRVETQIQASETSEILDYPSEVKGKTLPAIVSSPSWGKTLPAVEGDHSLPEPQSWYKWRVSKFHLVPKFRTKHQHHKNKVEIQIQAAETSEVLDILSEVKGKTLPPSVPSLWGERTLPGAESDHSLPEPQGRYKWRVSKFYLVPKFRTKTQLHKNRVERQIQAAETSEVLDIPSEFKGWTLPPSDPYPSWEETLPATENDHSLPQPQGRYTWRVSKFHLVPKFRTKMRHRKTKVETQKQPAETSEVPDFPSEVKGKTLPPTVPSPSWEQTLPSTEGYHSLPQPHVQYNWRVSKFHLVSKFKIQTKHFKNRVEPLIQSTENTNVLYIPSESATQSSSFARMLSTIFRRFSCFKCHSRL